MKELKVITPHEALAIVRAYSEEPDATYSSLANRFGVCSDSIRKTVQGVTDKGKAARDRYELERVLTRIGSAMKAESSSVRR